LDLWSAEAPDPTCFINR